MRKIIFLILFCCLSVAAWADVAPAPEGIQSEHAFSVAPGAADTLSVKLTNSGAAQPVSVIWEVFNVDGASVRSESTTALVGAGAATPVRYTLDSGGLAVGEYLARFTLRVNNQVAASIERSFVIAGPGDLYILFDREPIARGLTFNREGTEPQLLDMQGVKHWIWRASSAFGADAWWKSLLVSVTDPSVQNGKRPVADITISFRQAPNAPVTAFIDAVSGSRKIAEMWGNNPKWQVMRNSVSDAFFGARKRGADPKKLEAEGCDLRFNACNDSAQVRAIFIRSFDPAAPSEWSRYLTLDKVTDNHANIVAPGDTEKVTFAFMNRALVAARGTLYWQVQDAGGRAVRSMKQAVSLAPSALTEVSYPFDTKDLPVGEYSVRAEITPEGAATAAFEHSFAVAGPDDLFVIFDKEPIARGITFDKEGMQPEQVDVNGAKHWAWRVSAVHGADGWWHSALFTITDPRFTSGKRPVADINVVYRHTSNAPVELAAVAGGAPRIVGNGWGNNPNWQTMGIQLDDAEWQQKKTGSDPKARLTDGYDLRYNACSIDGELRSIFIRSYDLDHPDFRRLLRFKGMDAGRDLFIFAPGEKQNFSLKLHNLANLPLDAVYATKLSDDMGNVLWTKNAKTAVTARGPFNVPVAFDTKGLKKGVYTLALDLGTQAAAGRTDLLKTQVNLMVSDTQAIAPAKPGEFLYGLDTGVDYQDERFMKWAQFMGASTLRTPGTSDYSMLDQALAMCDKYGLKPGIMFGPPYDPDPTVLQKRIDEEAARAGAVAKKYGPRLKYYELGNEPDLTFFYPGPMEAYTRGFTAMSRAIKAASPNAVVMNGGLCFVGTDGYRRACQFIEMVPKDAIDAFAYHGHGPGSTSERNAYNNMHAQAEKVGKADRPFVETESGYSAHTISQERVQARTAIEKLVYAQSVHLPTFYWFRLLISGGDGDYTNLINVQEPRPVVLSYRTMVKCLRNRAYDKTVDLASPNYECYTFREKAGSGRALVLWANAGEGARRMLALSPDAATVKNLRLVDMFGNEEPLRAPGGVVSVPVLADPQFILWDSAVADEVKMLPSPLEAPAVARVLAGSRDEIAVLVRNDTGATLNGTLEIEAGKLSGVQPVQPSIAVSVPPHASATIKAAVIVADQASSIVWPHRWSAFVNIPANLADIPAMTSIPASLNLRGKDYPAVPLALVDGKIDLEAAGGSYREKAEALLLAEIMSPKAQTIRVGAAADWWMAWFVNGKPVFDTLDAGNSGGLNLADHQFEIPLKAGRNLLAVRVLSGSQGWKFMSGGPDEIAQLATAGGKSPGRVTFTLKQNGMVLAGESSAVAMIKRVPAPGNLGWDAAPADWAKETEDGTFGDVGVVNLLAAQPDASKWWKGLNDLSGQVWLRADAKDLLLTIAVRDDVNLPAKTPEEIETGDAVRVAFAGADGKSLDLGVPGIGNGVYRAGADGAWSPLGKGEAEVRVERIDAQQGGVTWYRIRVSRALLPQGKLSVNLVAYDNDWGEAKQHASWRPGFDPRARRTEDWYMIALP